MQKLINERQLAELTGLSVQTLRNHRHIMRGIPYIKLGGEIRGAVRYDLNDVEKYVKNRRIDPETY